MTVAIGTIGREGIVIGADREITHTVNKTRERKIWTARYSNLSAVVTGAGTWGYLRSACEKIVRVLSAATTLDDAQELVQETIRAIYGQEIEIDPARLSTDPPFFHLVIGVWTPSSYGLIRSEGTTVTRSSEPRSEFLGVGGPLAERLCTGYLGTILSNKQASIVITNAIRIVKESVPGCGGPTDTVLLNRDGSIEWDDTRYLDQVARKIEMHIRPLLLACTDHEIPESIFNGIIETLRVQGLKLREEEGRETSPTPFGQ